MLPLIVLNIALAGMNLLLYDVERSEGRNGRFQLVGFWFALIAVIILTAMHLL